jgi:NitT/TauT family transport system substrate-binding protein
MRIRLVATALVAAAVLAVTAGCGGGSSSSADGNKLTKINFGYIPDFETSSLLPVAEDQGYWKAAGLEPSFKSFTNGPLQIQALQTNDLDFASVGNGALWLVASGKAKIIAFNAMSQSDRVIAQPGITSLEQLKGKTVAVPQGTSGETILSLALEKAGMTTNDVKVVNMDPTTIVQAFLSHQVDAAGIWYPLVGTVKDKIPDLVELAEDADFTSTLAFPDTFLASNQMIEKNSDTVKKVIHVLQQANDYRIEHMDEAASVTADFLQQPVADMKSQVPYTGWYSTADIVKANEDGSAMDWFNHLADYFRKSGKITSVPDAKTYYEGDLYNSVYKSNG